MAMSELIALCNPENMGAVQKTGMKAACAAWRTGEDGRLWRLALPKVPPNSAMAIAGNSAEELPLDDVLRECSRLGLNEVLFLCEKEVDTTVEGVRIYAPRSTAISGGSLKQIFSGAAAALVEPAREHFFLSAAAGGSEPISSEQLENFLASSQCIEFSEELGCKYAFSDSGCVLYDDAQSLCLKLELLESIGVEKIVLPFELPAIRELLQSLH